MTAGIRTMSDLSAMCVNGFHDACDDNRCLDYCHDAPAEAVPLSEECVGRYHEACPDGPCVCVCHLPDPLDLDDEFGPWPSDEEAR